MIFLKRLLLITFCSIIFVCNLLASEMNFQYEKKTIKQHCDIIFKLSNNQSFYDFWEITKIDDLTDEYFNKEHQTKIKISKLVRGSKINGLRYIFFDKKNNPHLLINVDKLCKVRLSRLLIRENKNKISSIATLSSDLTKIIKNEKLNPNLKSAKPFRGVKVAIVDTGVNYNLDFISAQISRKDPSTLTGYDFEDNDSLPFDIDIGRSIFFPMHHGTAVSSIILREAPMSELVVYRFPRSNMCRFEELINHIAANEIKIVNLSMGSSNKSDWSCFLKAASYNKNILFFVSAGNDGKNIDKSKVFPASLELENILVISSSDISGDLAHGSNFGKKTVDFLIPGEQVPVIDHRGVKTKASGSSFAVPRIVAMAVRYLSKKSNATINDIKSVLVARAINNNQHVKYGWIPDPLDDYLLN
jgi:subtilisin family serine protease